MRSETGPRAEIGRGRTRTVGMIGFGAIGRAFAALLRAGGVECVVHDVDGAAREAAADAGFAVARSAADLAASCEIVGVVVRTDQQVLDAATGRDGALATAATGTVLILHSTISPRTAQAVASLAGPHGVDVLDAPVVGRPATVVARGGWFLAGGPPDVVERVRPHLLMLGREVSHMGPVGAGNVAKLMRNVLLGADRLVLQEVLRLGEAAGIEYARALDTLRVIQSGQQSVLDRWRDVFDTTSAGPRLETGDLHLFDKDIPLALELARQSGLDLPIIEQICEAGLRLGEDADQA